MIGIQTSASTAKTATTMRTTYIAVFKGPLLSVARTQNRIVERAARRSARMRRDHPCTRILDPHHRRRAARQPRPPGCRVCGGRRPREHHGDLPSTLSSAHSASSASEPRTTSSCVLVSSLHTAARRCAAELLDGVAQAGREPSRRLEEHRGALLGGRRRARLRPIACAARSPRSRTSGRAAPRPSGPSSPPTDRAGSSAEHQPRRRRQPAG